MLMAVPLCKESQPLYLPQGANLKLQPLVNFEYVSGECWPTGYWLGMVDTTIWE